MNIMKRTESYRINFNEKEMNVLTFLMKHYSTSKPQDLMRLLVVNEHARLNENRMRYGKSDRLATKDIEKRSLEDLSRELEAMDDGELTEYLVGIGYLKGPQLADPEQPGSSRMKREMIVTDVTTLEKHLVQVITEAGESGGYGPEVYRRTVFMSLDEIMRDMQKLKII